MRVVHLLQLIYKTILTQHYFFNNNNIINITFIYFHNDINKLIFKLVFNY